MIEPPELNFGFKKMENSDRINRIDRIRSNPANTVKRFDLNCYTSQLCCGELHLQVVSLGLGTVVVGGD